MFDDDTIAGKGLPPVPFSDQVLRQTVTGNGGSSIISGFVPRAPTVKRGDALPNGGSDFMSKQSAGRHYGNAVYSGLLGSGYTLRGNPARFLLPESDNLSPAAAISGTLDNWPANSSTNVVGASKALRPRKRGKRKNTKYGKKGKKKSGLLNTPFQDSVGQKGSDLNSVKEMQARNSAAKPRFLKELESFVESELALLGLQKDDGEASAARLQVFREAFQYVIDDFKTYKPILSAIKNEYDMLLDKYAKRLHYIPPLKARLSTIQADADQQIKYLKEKHETECSRKEKKISILTDSNENFKELNKKLTDDNLKLTKELDAQRAKYLDMKTANLSLVASVQHKEEVIADEALKLSNQTDRATYLGLQAEQSQMKYETAMAEIKKLRNEISELKAQAKAPEISPSQMLAVQKKLQKAREDLDKGAKAFQKMQKENTKLTIAVEELSNTRKELEKKLEKFQSQDVHVFASKIVAERMTSANVVMPSPSVEGDVINSDASSSNSQYKMKDCLMACLHHIDNLGLDEVDTGTSKRPDLVTIRGFERDSLAIPSQQDMFKHLEDAHEKSLIKPPLLTSGDIKQAGNAMDARKAKEKHTYFTGLGIGEDVPLYLRVNGRVKNLHLSKPTVERFIKTCWIQKGRKRYTKSLESFMHVMLCEKFPKRLDDRLSFAYSFREAVEKYSYDADCDLFNEVLHGRLTEDVYLSQMRLIHKIQEAFIKEDRKDGEQTGKLRKTQILEIVKRLCPYKDKRRCKAIEQALFFDTQLHNVDYIKLFQEDEDGDQGKFVECIRDQYLEECTNFIEDIVEAMNVLKSTTKNAGVDITVHEIRQTLLAVAPNKTAENIDAYIHRGLGNRRDAKQFQMVDIDPKAMHSTIIKGASFDTVVDIDLFLERLKTGLLHPANDNGSK